METKKTKVRDRVFMIEIDQDDNPKRLKNENQKLQELVSELQQKLLKRKPAAVDEEEEEERKKLKNKNIELNEQVKALHEKIAAKERNLARFQSLDSQYDKLKARYDDLERNVQSAYFQKKGHYISFDPNRGVVILSKNGHVNYEFSLTNQTAEANYAIGIDTTTNENVTIYRTYDRDPEIQQHRTFFIMIGRQFIDAWGNFNVIRDSMDYRDKMNNSSTGYPPPPPLQTYYSPYPSPPPLPPQPYHVETTPPPLLPPPYSHPRQPYQQQQEFPMLTPEVTEMFSRIAYPQEK